MIASRIAAVVAAAALIVGAIAIRNQLIDGDSSDDTPNRTDSTVLVCVTELADACRASVDDDITVRIEAAGDTLDDLVEGVDPVMWVTFQPFPAMVDSARTAIGEPPIAYETTTVSSSEMSLVAEPAVIARIQDACSDTAAWRCIADLDLNVGFARSSASGTGLLGVAQVALDYESTGGIPVGDAFFVLWFENIVTSVAPVQMSGATAIDTIQTRSSSMDVAVGARAQLGDDNGSDLGVAYAEPMIRADVVLAAPPGMSVPSALADRLTNALVEAGWDTPDRSGGSPDPATMLAIRTLWEEVQE